MINNRFEKSKVIEGMFWDKVKKIYITEEFKNEREK